jgi:hypothetical protein
MCSSNRPSNHITRLGLILLAVANLFTYLLTRHSRVPEYVADPAAGFMMGAAITVLILGIYKQGRSLRM